MRLLLHICRCQASSYVREWLHSTSVVNINNIMDGERVKCYCEKLKRLWFIWNLKLVTNLFKTRTSWHAPLTQEQVRHGCLKIYIWSTWMPRYDLVDHKLDGAPEIKYQEGHSSEHYSGIRQLQKNWGLGRRICFCSSQFVKRNIGRVRIFSVLDCNILRGAWISVGIYVFHFSGSHEVSPIIYVLFSCKNLYTEGSWGQVYHCNFANHLLLSSLSPFSYLVIHISYFGMQLMSADNEEFMVVGVLGASGLGRSTILNEIYGFEPSTRG